MIRRPRPVGTKRPANVSDLQNEITPGVYYESSKTVREVRFQVAPQEGEVSSRILKDYFRHQYFDRQLSFFRSAAYRGRCAALFSKFRRAAKWPIQWSKEFALAFADVTDVFYRQS